jgi:hypothetical protein
MLEMLRMVFAGIGAALILTALTFVTLLIGVLVTTMVILLAGPLVDKIITDSPEAGSSRV